MIFRAVCIEGETINKRTRLLSVHDLALLLGYMNENVLFGHVLFSLPQNKTKICKKDHKPYCYCWNQLQPCAQIYRRSFRENWVYRFGHWLSLLSENLHVTRQSSVMTRWRHDEDKGLGTNLPPIPGYISGIAVI